MGSHLIGITDRVGLIEYESDEADDFIARKISLGGHPPTLPPSTFAIRYPSFRYTNSTLRRLSRAFDERVFGWVLYFSSVTLTGHLCVSLQVKELLIHLSKEPNCVHDCLGESRLFWFGLGSTRDVLAERGSKLPRDLG